MKKTLYPFFSILLLLSTLPLYASTVCSTEDSSSIITGAMQYNQYKALLQHKRVALVVNQTATVNDTLHLVDFLIEKKVKVTKVFAPEHGFRGNADAGEHLSDAKDKKTGLPIISLYGENRRPSKEMYKNVDVVIYDIQDVGVRFYTFISTLHHVMDACAEYNVPLIVLDRPNPNGDYVDGPVLDTTYRSFVGIDPIPVVHGLTVGEFAQMVNGEGWLPQGRRCKLTVIPVQGWNHSMPYELPVKPSPNLPNNTAIRLYPSLCYLEPTTVSLGRGTEFPFQVIGYPDSTLGSFTFTPRSIKGMSSNPKHLNETCYGTDLRTLTPLPHFTLKYLIEAYQSNPDKEKFFTSARFFNLLAGNNILIEQIKKGMTEEQIKATWQPQLNAYKDIRKKYLIYK